MLSRLYFILFFTFMLAPNVQAAQCLNVFSSETNEELLNTGLEFINVPAFTGADGSLLNPAFIFLGDSQHLSNTSQQYIYVWNFLPLDETTARLYIANETSWNNAKINVGGEPEELIIIVNGSLSISGGQTEINAIIYSTDSISVSGNVTINGSLAAEGSISTTPSANINYDQSAIENADFNDMCGTGVPRPPVFDYCENTFVDGATSVGNGKIKVENSPALTNEADLNLQTKTLEGKGGATLACSGTFGSGECSALGTGTDELNLGVFYESNDKAAVLSITSPETIGDDGKQNFGIINISNGGHLTFAGNTSGQYFIEEMNVLESEAATSAVTIYLAPGDYYIGELETYNNTTFEINGNGAVRIFLRDHSDIEGNTQGNIGGAPEDFLLYGFHDLHIKGTTQFYGLIYAQHNAELKDTVKITGAISGLNEVKLKGSSQITYTCEALPTGTILAKYQFEQLDFTTQIDDSSGLDNHAENLSGASTPDGKYCRGFESENWNNYNVISDAFRSSLDLNDDVGLQGTISFWFNSSINWNAGSERVLFDASADSGASDKYFVFEIQQDGRLKFSFEDSDDADFNIVEASTNSRIADSWYYLTVTWDYLSNDFAIYVDGTLQVQQARNTNGAMGELQEIVFGDNSSDYTQAGNSAIASPYSSLGNYDEVRIYNKVLTQSEIQDDMNDNNGCVVSLIAEWRMDELSWSGILGEVQDETGNFNSQAINGASTDNSEPALVGNPGTCGYGVFDGVNDYLAVPTSFENQQDSFTITAWIKPSNLDTGSRIFADDENNSQGYAFSLGDPGSGRLRFYSRGVNPISVDTIANVIPTNTWTFVAAVHNSTTKTREIYVNGVAQTVTGGGLSHVYSGNWGVDTGIASIGGETNSGETSNRFTGAMDEVRMYKGALSGSEIIAVQHETHPCVTSTDLFQISHDGAGLTCAPEPILIRACSNASCSSFDNTVNTTVIMQINGGVNQNIDIVNGSSVNETFSYTDINTPAVLSLTSDYLCSDTSDSSAGCAVDFAEAGFLLNLANHLSCTTSDLTIQAVKLSDSGLECTPAYTGDQSVGFVFNYSNPTSGSEVPSLNAVDMAAASVIQNRIVNFDGTGTANLNFTYLDAGEIRIDVSDTASAGLTPSSVTAIVTPAKLIVASPDTDADCVSGDGSDIGCTAFKVAGEHFNLDISAACSNNTITKNFEMNDIPLTVTTIAPDLGNPVSLGVTSVNVEAADDGSHRESNQTVSEVGVFTITATPAVMGYFGETIPAATSVNIGRFYPDHFVLDVDTHGELTAYCDNETTSPTAPVAMPFAYSGQLSSASPSTGGAIRYSGSNPNGKPSFTITAKSLNAVNTTKNYTGAFMKLVDSSITRKTIVQGTDVLFSPIVDGNQDGTQGTKLALTSDLIDVTTADLQGGEALGVVNYTYKNNDNFFYHHELNSEINLFISDINLPIVSVIDLDGVTALDADGDFDNDGDTSNALDSVLTLEPTGVEIRFGRANLENSYGPETSSIPQVLSVEYFENDSYILAADDICSLYNTDKVNFGTLNEVALDKANIVPVDGKFDDVLEPPNGLTRQIVLPPAGVDNRGRVEVIYTIYDWLKYDWTGDGNFTDNPSAIATFGIFRGNDRIIYQREIQQ